jgi:apolipoprotein N-acyltransferase
MGYLSLFALIWCFLHHYLWGRSRSLALLVAPFSWVSIEYLKGLGELGFTWGQMSYSLTNFPVLLQLAEITGPYGISLWIVAVNVFLYLSFQTADKGKKILNLSLVSVSIICVIGFGLNRYRSFEPESHINIGMIQPGLDQDVKWNPAYQDSIIEMLFDQTREVAGEDTDLVIWPETAVPSYLKYDLVTMTMLSELTSDLRCAILLGAPHYVIEEGEYSSFNIALMYNDMGRLDDKIYKKIHLVPFGEKTPWEDKFEFLEGVDLGGGHFTAGSEFTLFELGDLDIGTLICFESIFPELARNWRKKGAGLLVNITNDAWFKRTSAPFQHASAVVLRAIENRISIARSANTGVSMTVDPLGRVRKSTGIFVKVVMNDRLPVGGKHPFYTEAGDLVIIPCWIIFLAGILAGRMIETSEVT